MHSHSEHYNAMHRRSGSFTSNDPLVGFFYDLLVSGACSPGQAEELFLKQTHEVTTYSNGWVAQYASDLARRLKH